MKKVQFSVSKLTLPTYSEPPQSHFLCLRRTACIGVLGSWISGGVFFYAPFSTFFRFPLARACKMC